MDKGQRLYLWLCAVFVTCLVVADTIGGKFFVYGPVLHSCGQLSFPVTFLLTDTLNEFYGTKGARRVTVLGLCMTSLAFAIYSVAVAMPIAHDSPIDQRSFATVFGLSQKLILASLTAYLVGQLIDIQLFAVFKRLTRGRFVWLRATGSTLISQAIDTLIISFILNAGTKHQDGTAWSVDDILKFARTGYVLKFFIALALTPLIYLLRWFIRTRIGLQPMPAGS
jgi:queuosine precursor transporter